MYQLWIFNTTFNDFQRVGTPISHADALKWIVTLRQHFDVREFQLLAEGTPAEAVISARSVWPGE